jgi:hypothetical protein
VEFRRCQLQPTHPLLQHLIALWCPSSSCYHINATTLHRDACALQCEQALAGRCVQLSISSGQQEQWQACVGGLRLGLLLGCSPAGEQLEALKTLKAAALQDNGTDALLAAEQVDRVLRRVSA